MKLAKVFRWEFSQTVRSKQFVITTVILPVILAVVIFAATSAFREDAASTGDAPPPVIIGLFLGALMFIGAFISGIMTMYSVMKEKQSRVIEMMMSSVSAWDLMAGKVIGLGLALLVVTTDCRCR